MSSIIAKRTKKRNISTLETIQKSLSDNHYNHLKNEGFTDEHILKMIQEYGVRSVSEEEAKKLGYQVHLEGHKHPVSSSGLLFPNEIKFDNPKLPKYCQKPGSKIEATLPENCQVITEGFKDAFAGSVHGKIPTGSVSGVWSFEKVLPKNSGYTLIFDSDGWSNPSVIYPLLKAGHHVNGQINLIPTIEGQPKAGLCEFFKAGYTSEDYKSLVDNAFKPDDLFKEWINNHLHKIDDSKIDKGLSFIADYALKYFGKVNQLLIKDQVYEGFKKHKIKVTKSVINEVFSAKKEILELEQRSNESHSDDSEGETYFTEVAYREIYEGKHYISIMSPSGKLELYKYKNSHYILQKEHIEHKRIINWLQNYDPHKLEDSNVLKIWKWLLMKVQVCSESVNVNGINLKNGVLKIAFDKDGKGKFNLENHSPKQIFTYCSEVEYNPEADLTHTNKVLDCLDPESRKIFLRTIALSFDLPYFLKKLGRPRALMLSGKGNNGKDALRALVTSIFGDAVGGCSLSDFESYDRGRKFPLSKLMNIKLSWSTENASLEKLEKLQSIKAAISCDPIACEPKNKDEKMFTPRAILLFNCNDMPKIASNLEAIRTRWAILNFSKTYSIKPNKRQGQLKADPRYKDDLEFIAENIAPGFLNLLEKELEDLAINGIDFDPVTENLEALQRESCHIFQFCEDLGIKEDLEAKIFINDLWDLLRYWYIDQGILEIEYMEKGKEKMIWHDLPSRSDKLVKASNQVYKRFMEVFPTVKRERETVDQENVGKFYLKGIGQIASLASYTCQTSDTASLTASLNEATHEATSLPERGNEANEVVESILSDVATKNFKKMRKLLNDLNRQLEERSQKIEQIKETMLKYLQFQDPTQDFIDLRAKYLETDLLEAFNRLDSEDKLKIKRFFGTKN